MKRIVFSHRSLTRTFVVCALFALAGVAATAANATPPGGAAGALSSGGKVLPDQGVTMPAFLPAPGKGTYGYYQANISPASSASAPEILNFTCTYPANLTLNKAVGGMPITSDDRDALRNAVTLAAAAWSHPPEDNPTPAQRTAAMEAAIFASTALRAEMVAQKGQPMNVYNQNNIAWQGDTADALIKQIRSDGGPTFQSFSPGVVTSSVVTEILRLAENPVGGKAATNPDELKANLPSGCDLGEFAYFPNMGDGGVGLLLHPLELIQRIIVGMPGSIVHSAFTYAEPLAFSYLFFTPHSERGDTIFNMPLDCKTSSGFCTTNAVKAADGTVAVAANTPLGYDKANLKAKEPPLWIKLSMLFSWLISLSYGLIIVGAGLLYMFRGHHARTAQAVMQLLPRLVMTMILTVLSAWLIGLAITFSNLFVQALFGGDNDNAMRAMHSIFQSFGGDGGSVGSTFVSQFFAVLGLAATDVFLFAFYLASIVRQFLLIFLITLAPIGLAAMLFDRTRDYFSRYVTILLTLIATPVVLAVVMKVGLAFTMTVIGTSGADGSVGIHNSVLGVIMLLIVFAIMLKVIKSSVAVVTGKQSPGLMSRVGKMAQQRGQMRDGKMGALLSGAGTIAERGGQRSEQAFGALIPAGRMRALSTRRMPKEGQQRSLLTELRDDHLIPAAIGVKVPFGTAPTDMQAARRASIAGLVLGGNGTVQKQFDAYSAKAKGLDGAGKKLEEADTGVSEISLSDFQQANVRAVKAMTQARNSLQAKLDAQAAEIEATIAPIKAEADEIEQKMHAPGITAVEQNKLVEQRNAKLAEGRKLVKAQHGKELTLTANFEPDFDEDHFRGKRAERMGSFTQSGKGAGTRYHRTYVKPTLDSPVVVAPVAANDPLITERSAGATVATIEGLAGDRKSDEPKRDERGRFAGEGNAVAPVEHVSPSAVAPPPERRTRTSGAGLATSRPYVFGDPA